MLVALGMTTVVVFTVVLVLSVKRRKIVSGSSIALAELGQLNTLYALRLTRPPAIRYDFMDAVSSKAKHDRYDLAKFFHERLVALEAEIQSQVDRHLADMTTFAEYADNYNSLRAVRLGRSMSDRLSPEKYQKIEEKLFAKRRLCAPNCAAQVRCTVTYTSPKGQNSYSKSAQWDFDQLRHGLAEMRSIREQRSTTQFLRQ